MSSPAVDNWTVMRLLHTSAGYLGEKGAGSPRLDAELLLGHVLGVSRIKLYTEFDKPVTDEERGAYRELIRRRSVGEPVAYILGEKEFYGRPFKVDKRVLVPRPETEIMVDVVRRDYPDTNVPLRIADMGTGSGILAVTLALEYPHAEVDAVEISKEALEVAKLNADALGASERVRFHEGSWVTPVREHFFDLVVANPPYIADGDTEVEDAVERHEPGGALFAGEDGLDAVRDLAHNLFERLVAGGRWYCEIGYRQSESVREIAEAEGWSVAFENDLAGIPRILIAERPE